MRSIQLGRREFITLIGGAAATWPLGARAQQPNRVHRIGVLMTFPEGDTEGNTRLAAFQQGLKDLSWVDGRNLRIDYRWTGADIAQMRVAAKELCDLQPDLIMATTTPAVLALKQETRTISIVFLQVSDPVGSGLVANLARPGDNLTGFTNFEFSIGSKWLQLIKEIAPNVLRVGIMFNPTTAPYADAYMRSVEAAGPTLSIAMLPVSDAGSIEPAIVNLAATPNSALIVITDIFTTINKHTITTLAAKYQLPAIYPFKFFAVDGGLISYGIDNIEIYRRAATYVDRILKGTPVAELPIQQPIKYELIINLKTAKALGLDVPLHLQQRADEVIE
jgi:putative ABC transport system substrate-binding protein